MNTKKIKKFISKIDWSITGVLKGVALVFSGIVAIAIALTVLGSAWRFGFGGGGNDYGYRGGGFGGEMVDVMEEGFNMARTASVKMAAPMIAQDMAIMPEPGFDGGADAEEYERRSYSAQYEARKIEPVCEAVEELKPFEHVVFTHSNVSERYCSYNFNVESAYEEDVVTTLKALNPEDWSENVYTLEHNIDDSSSEIAILQRKLTSLNETLAQAEVAYDEAMRGARGVKDYSAIAQIVNNKVSIIERLTQQKLNVQSQIDRYEKKLGRTTEEVEYTHFSVRVEKDVLIDWEHLGTTWKYELDDFVMSVNQALQKMTMGVALLLVTIIQWLIYAFVALVVVRVVWLSGKRIFRWTPKVLK